MKRTMRNARRRRRDSVLPSVLTAWLASFLAAGCQVEAPPNDVSGTGLPVPSALAEVPGEMTPDDVLGATVDFLGGTNELSVTTVVTFEALQDDGQVLHFGRAHRISLARPDRLFWETIRDDASADSAWFADGTMSMLKRPSNIYGQVDLPTDLPAAVDELSAVYGIRIPMADLLAGRARENLIEAPVDKWYVGRAWIDGGWTHHIALRYEQVDLEIWIRADGDPLPVRMAITWINEPGAPTYVARFTNWDLSPAFDDRTFQFQPPDDASEVPVLPAEPVDVAEGS